MSPQALATLAIALIRCCATTLMWEPATRPGRKALATCSSLSTLLDEHGPDAAVSEHDSCREHELRERLHARATFKFSLPALRPAMPRPSTVDTSEDGCGAGPRVDHTNNNSTT